MKKEERNIDLGLADLIASISEQEGADYTEIKNARSSLKSRKNSESTSKTSPQTTTNVRAALRNLALNSDWKALSTKAENLMSQQSNRDHDPEPVIWWALAELKRNGVPTPILAAPLDQAAEIVRSKISTDLDLSDLAPYNSLPRLTMEVLVLAAQSLEQQGEPRLAQKFIEHKVEIEQKIQKMGKDKFKEDKDSPSSHLDSTEKNVSLETNEGKTNYVHPLTARETQPEAVDGVILEEYAENTNFSADINSPFTVQPITYTTKNRKISHRAIATSCFVLLLLLAIKSIVQQFSSDPNEPLAILAQPALITSIAAPATSTKETSRIKSIDRFDALYYQLENAQPPNEAPPVVSTIQLATELPSNSENTVASTTTEKQEVAPNPIKQIQKAQIDMTGPIEPNDIAGNRKTNDKSLSQVDSRDQSKNMSTYPSDISINPPLPEVVAGNNTMRPKAEAVAKNDLYETLIRTNVMELPAFRSKVVSYLDRGTRIKVIRNLGEWLEIRSRKGRPGFILAQDVTGVN